MPKNTRKGTFAHISDCHIGAWRDPILRMINDSAFVSAIDICISRGVDFVLISGDIFDTGLPEMSSVRSAVRKLRELSNKEIPVYVVYGSHDYSPTTVSVVEVLTSAGLFVNVGEFTPSNKASGSKFSLQRVLDPRTDAIISGLPARRGGLEKGFYEHGVSQDGAREAAPASPGLSGDSNDGNRYSIFVFHASVSELQSLNIPIEQNVSLEDLPKGFSYYAGGHIHKSARNEIDGSPVVYPGPLFGTSFADLEMIARGEKRGFEVVGFEGSRTVKTEFVELDAPKVLLKVIDAQDKSIEQVEQEIRSFISPRQTGLADAIPGSIVLLKVRGTLSSGRASDIDWYDIRQKLVARKARVVNINRAGLFSKESQKLLLLGASTREEIESKLLEKHIHSYSPQNKDLQNLAAQSGVRIASALLGALKSEKKEEETRQNYESRIWKEAAKVLGIPDESSLSVLG